MNAKDPHRFSHELDEAATRRLIDRLESRAKDTVFTNLFDDYVRKLEFPHAGRILEVGCGTGAMTRALARKKVCFGTLVGIDQCAAFIEAAKRLAAAEGVGESVEFEVGDSHDLAFADASFDLVIAHTVISHVTDPELVLKELARVLRPGGSLVVFDGDYGSLTYAYPHQELGQRMDHALATVTFNNPLIMRSLMRILPRTGLEVRDAWANVVAEIGSASYFKSFAETYKPLVVSSGLLTKVQVDEWSAMQEAAMNDGSFFASCNYYTFLARKT